MQTKITPEAIDELFKKIEAASYPPQSDHIFFALQSWVDNIPEYFYKDETGQWWFETPWTCRVKTQIIPQRFQCDYGILVPEEEIYSIKIDIDNAIYTAFAQIGDKNEL